MFPLIDDRQNINKFVYVELPSKAQIFARTGQHAVSPSGSYTGDESADFGKHPTQSANDFVNAAESYEKPMEDLPE